jgi:maltooligosyltrehalose trehalohydrolase
MNDLLARRRLPIGAELLDEKRVHFRLWAPHCRRVELVARDQAGRNEVRLFELQAEGTGYFSLLTEMEAGARYAFRLDGAPSPLPDPASRFQPNGPEGFSQIVDPRTYKWSDDSWPGLEPKGQVLYEMHIGTFTPAGTWQAAAAELRELARAGMTVLEIMPVADFVGEFGWGYDGVCMFAPTRLYGAPDDFRQFVDQAHAAGLGVILDVVYNHFGNVGNTIPRFAADYKSQRYKNEWGDAINFDGPNSGPVRDFFRANVRYWIEEFHLDGLRFDAVPTIQDNSEKHILSELTTAAREAAGSRRVLLVAENERQTAWATRPVEKGGYGMDAAWNDDFHHAAMVRLTGRSEAYYSDYLGAPEEFIGALKWGFLYQGQLSRWQHNPRGTPSRDLPATAFVSFLQNHDQIANSGPGERIDRLTSPGRLRAMTALWLLSPQTPLFFQGQEYSSSRPFLYFADPGPTGAPAVRKGRAESLSQFPSLATAEAQQALLDPAARETFDRCKLDSSERAQHPHSYALHTDLLWLRREDPIFREQRADWLEGAALSPDAFCLRFFEDAGHDRLVLVNFGRDLLLFPVPQPLLAPPFGRQWKLLWSSNSVLYGGPGTPPIEVETGWRLPGEATVVMQAVWASEAAQQPPARDKTP